MEFHAELKSAMDEVSSRAAGNTSNRAKKKARMVDWIVLRTQLVVRARNKLKELSTCWAESRAEISKVIADADPAEDAAFIAVLEERKGLAEV